MDPEFLAHERRARTLHEQLMPGQEHPLDEPRSEWPCWQMTAEAPS